MAASVVSDLTTNTLHEQQYKHVACPAIQSVIIDWMAGQATCLYCCSCDALVVRSLTTLAAIVYFRKWPPPVGVSYTAASRLQFLARQAAGVGLLFVVYTVGAQLLLSSC